MSHHSKWVHYTSDELSGYERMRVDSGQTGFFEGREFRSFLDLSLAVGASQVIRVTTPCPIHLSGQNLSVDAGKVRMDVYLSPTPSGTWNSALPIIGKNRTPERRFPYYVPQLTLDTGGTITGGTLVETIRAAASGNGSNQSTVGANMDDVRGLPAGTYYIKFTNIDNGTSNAIYSLWWEERARHPDWKTKN